MHFIVSERKMGSDNSKFPLTLICTMKKANLLCIVVFAAIKIKLKKININHSRWKCMKIDTQNALDHWFSSISNIDWLLSIICIKINYIHYGFSSLEHTGHMKRSSREVAMMGKAQILIKHLACIRTKYLVQWESQSSNCRVPPALYIP